MARDTRALTDEVEFFDEPTPEMKQAVQRVVCRYSADAAEAAQLMQMLGVHPLQTTVGLADTMGRFT